MISGKHFKDISDKEKHQYIYIQKLLIKVYGDIGYHLKMKIWREIVSYTKHTRHKIMPNYTLDVLKKVFDLKPNFDRGK